MSEQAEILATCETCGKHLYQGDQYFSFDDGPDFCGNHAPTIADCTRMNEEFLALPDQDEEDREDANISIANLKVRLAAGESQDTKVVHEL